MPPEPSAALDADAHAGRQTKRAASRPPFVSVSASGSEAHAAAWHRRGGVTSTSVAPPTRITATAGELGKPPLQLLAVVVGGDRLCYHLSMKKQGLPARQTRAARAGMTLGLEWFEKISAVEDIKLTESARRRAAEFDRLGLSPAERRKAILDAYRNG